MKRTGDKDGERGRCKMKILYEIDAKETKKGKKEISRSRTGR
jgi:hypothetical protein